MLGAGCIDDVEDLGDAPSLASFALDDAVVVHAADVAQDGRLVVVGEAPHGRVMGVALGDEATGFLALITSDDELEVVAPLECGDAPMFAAAVAFNRTRNDDPDAPPSSIFAAGSVGNGACLIAFDGHGNFVASKRFEPLPAAADGGTVRVVDVDARAGFADVIGSCDPICSVEAAKLSCDAASAVSDDEDGEVYLWRTSLIGDELSCVRLPKGDRFGSTITDGSPLAGARMGAGPVLATPSGSAVSVRQFRHPDVFTEPVKQVLFGPPEGATGQASGNDVVGDGLIDAYLAGHFVGTLASVTADGEVAAGDIPSLSSGEGEAGFLARLNLGLEGTYSGWLFSAESTTIAFERVGLDAINLPLVAGHHRGDLTVQGQTIANGDHAFVLGVDPFGRLARAFVFPYEGSPPDLLAVGHRGDDLLLLARLVGGSRLEAFRTPLSTPGLVVVAWSSTRQE